ncbi:MAG: DUF192 domain-containing protein [Thauera sp.]|jgi:uncharacterized membrane protein (UPF0127 family)
MNRTMEGLVVGPRGTAFALLGVEGRPVNLGVEVAGSIRQRLRGWLGRMQAPPERGLWLVPCDAVHTMAMRFPVDLVFIDGGGRIRRIDSAVPPWRFRVCLGAHSVIELAAGQATRLGLSAGDCLERRRV